MGEVEVREGGVEGVQDSEEAIRSKAGGGGRGDQDSPKEAPRPPQDSPKRDQDPPERLQETSKIFPRDSKRLSEDPRGCQSCSASFLLVKP